MDESVLLECGPFSATNRDGTILFSDVEFRLHTSRLAVLEGQSGSGKSTLLRQVVGLIPAPQARRQLGHRRYEMNELDLWRSRVTLVAQDAPMLPGSVADNLHFPFALAVADQRRPDEDRQRELLEAARISDIPLSREVRTLSGGERHRLALVRALLWDPPVLLLDEPLSGLDPDRAEQAFDLILAQAHRPDRAVLASLHDPDLARQADHRLRLVGARLEGK